MRNSKGVIPIFILLVIAAIVVGGYFVYQKVQSRTLRGFLPRKGAPTVTIKRRSKAPGVVKSAVVAKGVDKAGKPKSISATFTSKDPNYKGVYVALELNNPQKGQKLAYVRYYFNTKKNKFQYIDHGTVMIRRPTVMNTYFHYYTKSGSAKVRLGQYLVKVYTNGKFERAAAYQII